MFTIIQSMSFVVMQFVLPVEMTPYPNSTNWTIADRDYYSYHTGSLSQLCVICCNAGWEMFTIMKRMSFVVMLVGEMFTFFQRVCHVL